MTDQELLDRADKLQQEAHRILGEVDLIKKFRKIGIPRVIGSAATGLMVATDIDILVMVEKYDVHRVVSLLPELAILPTINKVQFNNYREYRRDRVPNRAQFPHAYYIGVRSVQQDAEWKIDTWFLTRDDDTPDDSRLFELSNDQRLNILRLKSSWWGGEGYKSRVLSVDFYKAVLDHNVRTEQDFKKYLRSKT